jgi:hypothetical protein
MFELGEFISLHYQMGLTYVRQFKLIGFERGTLKDAKKAFAMRILWCFHFSLLCSTASHLERRR